MAEYPTDLDLNQHRDIHLDDTNDLALTSGVEQLYQSIGIDVSDELDEFLSGRVTASNIALLEGAIESGLQDDPQVGNVQSVSIEEFDRSAGAVTVAVHVIGNDDFTLPLTT